MKTNRIITQWLALAALAVFTLQPATAFAQGTAFTYQGRLNDGGQPANGTNYGMVFYLYNVPTGGTALGNLGIVSVTVSNGLFTTPLDFGNQFDGTPRWLEISVQKNGGSFTTLAPRQQVLPTPYAILAGTAGGLSGTLPVSQVSGVVPLAQLPAAVMTNNATGVTLSGNLFGNFGGSFYGNGGGLTGLNPANLSAGTAAINISGNAATATTATTAANLTGNVSDAQLSANIARLNGTNNFTGTNTFAGKAVLTNVNNVIAGVINGNGGGLTNLNAANLTGTFTGNVIGAASSATSFSGSLAGDVTGTQSATVVSTLGGQTATNVASGASAANAATSVNIASTIVKRDASGNFSAGTVTLNGNLNLPATTASAGIIYSGGSTLIQSHGNGNFFAGPGAGNLSTGATNSTAIGYAALQSSASGDGDTAVGFATLQNNTTGQGNTALGIDALLGNSIGSYNTANGAYALPDNFTGSYNTAVGVSSLLNNQTGSNNIALGYLAGFYIIGSSNIDIGNLGLPSDNNVIRIGSGQTQTFIAGVINGNGAGLTNLNVASFTGSVSNLTLTGNLNLPAVSPNSGVIYSGGSPLLSGSEDSGNSFVGPNAGNLSMSGSGNTASGSASLYSTTSGNENTASGSGSLYSNTSGGDNTASGSGSLYSNISGGDNTANGANALFNNTSGGNNTASGDAALYHNNGSANTASGDEALYFNTTGYGNTAKGFEALLFNSTGSYNIALGWSAGINIYGNNNIDIGNTGISSDNGIIRIGTQGTQASTYIAGVSGTTAGSGYTPVMVNSSGQLATSTTTLVDPSDANTGSLRPGITFGAGLTGEGIASTRTTGIGWAGLDFYTGGTMRMRINNNGNVGIGTTNNAYLLQVGGSGSPAYCNGTSWVNGSDRNAKEAFTAINPSAVLEKVSALPITEWKYKVEADGTEHIGPMAQDFHAAFGLNGPDDKHIATVDEEGVALAAIQGLNQKMEEKEARIQEQAGEIADLKTRLEKLEQLVSQNIGGAK